MIVYNKEGKPKQLGEQLAKGGEGAVYPVANTPHILVKHYFSEKLAKNKGILQPKIELMSQLRQHFNLKRHKNISWVAIPVYDDKKQWIGYAMPRLQGFPLQYLAHSMIYKKYAPNLNRLDIAKLMLDWLNDIELLHRNNIMIGDYNLQNFLWDPNSKKIGFIDCDSYQIRYEGKHYPCLVGSPDLTAPEHHNKDFKTIVRTPESEYFSIAIILFKCFMLGRHPYDIVGGADPVRNMQQGEFAYGIGNGGSKKIPKGDWYNIWSHMSYDMKSLFIKTFTEGVRNPKKRATISEWKTILNKYIYEIKQNYHNIDIRPAHPKGPKSHKPSTLKPKS